MNDRQRPKKTVADFAEIYQALCDIDIQYTDMEGDIKSISEILAELADKWGNMTCIERNHISTLLVGKRHSTLIMKAMEKIAHERNTELFNKEYESVYYNKDQKCQGSILDVFLASFAIRNEVRSI